MRDTDLDDLAAELSEFAAPEKKGGRPPRDERSSLDLKKSSASSKSMAAPRSMGKTRTSSSGCMPSVSTACARLRTAAPCLRPLDHQGLLTSAPTRHRDRRGRQC
jgi:hypothetical protein